MRVEKQVTTWKLHPTSDPYSSAKKEEPWKVRLSGRQKFLHCLRRFVHLLRRNNRFWLHCKSTYSYNNFPGYPQLSRTPLTLEVPSSIVYHQPTQKGTDLRSFKRDYTKTTSFIRTRRVPKTFIRTDLPTTFPWTPLSNIKESS